MLGNPKSGSFRSAPGPEVRHSAFGRASSQEKLEPVEWFWRFPIMNAPAESAKNSVKIGKKNIVEQQLRIARQRELMTKLERHAHPDVVADARRALTEMEQMLVQMEIDYTGA
jgi:hypothetical protein